jgi:hypothetical protein
MWIWGVNLSPSMAKLKGTRPVLNDIMRIWIGPSSSGSRSMSLAVSDLARDLNDQVLLPDRVVVIDNVVHHVGDSRINHHPQSLVPFGMLLEREIED